MEEVVGCVERNGVYEMEEIIEALKIDWTSFLITLFAIGFAFKKICQLIGWVKTKFRIKTGVEEDKQTIEDRIGILEKHDKWQYNEISKISKGIDEIKERMDSREINDKARIIATLRTQLYDLHSKFIERGYVDKSGLKTFLDLGKIYEDAGGNDVYHDKLKPEVLALPIKDEK